MSVTIESRAYGPNSTPDEIEALRNRVSFHKGFTVLFREVPIGSEFQAGVCLGRVKELLHKHDCHSVIIDLSEANRPNPKFAEALKNQFRQMEDQLKHVVVFTGKNFLINVAAKFVLAGIPQRFAVLKTMAQAEEAIRNG